MAKPQPPAESSTVQATGTLTLGPVNLPFTLEAQVTITPGNGPTPPPDDYPNEPPGLEIASEWAMADPIPPGPMVPPGAPVPGPGEPCPPYTDDPIEGSGGWRCIYNHQAGSVCPDQPGNPYANTPLGWCLLDAAEDPPATCMVYPIGMRLGISPATLYKAWSTSQGYRRMYAGFWWKPSDPTDFGGIGQKICFMFNGGGGPDPNVSGGQAFLGFSPDRQLVVMPEYPDPPPTSPLYRVRYPNVTTTQVTLGEWHLVEWYLQIADHDDPAVNRCQWWLDNVLQGDYTDIWNKAPFDMFQFSPTFGGNGDTYKTEEDYYWFRNLRLCLGTL